MRTLGTLHIKSRDNSSIKYNTGIEIAKKIKNGRNSKVIDIRIENSFSSGFSPIINAYFELSCTLGVFNSLGILNKISSEFNVDFDMVAYEDKYCSLIMVKDGKSQFYETERLVITSEDLIKYNYAKNLNKIEASSIPEIYQILFKYITDTFVVDKDVVKKTLSNQKFKLIKDFKSIGIIDIGGYEGFHDYPVQTVKL